MHSYRLVPVKGFISAACIKTIVTKLSMRRDKTKTITLLVKARPNWIGLIVVLYINSRESGNKDRVKRNGSGNIHLCCVFLS